MKTLKTLKKLVKQSSNKNYYNNLTNVYKQNDTLLKTLLAQNK